MIDLLTGSEPNETLLFHYTKRETLWKILEGGELQLSPYASTNDPRETKEWVAEVIHEARDTDKTTAQVADEIRNLADSVLRGGARLACFTLDREMLEGAEVDSLFHRGWGRA